MIDKMRTGMLQARRDMIRTGLTATLSALASSCKAQETNRGTVPIEYFGGRTKAGFDNGPAFRSAFTELRKSRQGLQLQPGTYEIDSRELLRQGAIYRPSGVGLFGAGADQTLIKVAGSSVINQIFDASGSSDILTKDLSFIGNGVHDNDAPYAGAVFKAILGESADQDMANLWFKRCRFENFSSAAWLFFENQSARHAIQGIGSRDCEWISRTNLPPGASDITVPGHFVYCHGYAGPIRDVVVEDGVMEARFMKGGVALVGNISGGLLKIERLANAGQAIANLQSGPDGPGSYAVMLYGQEPMAPRGITAEINDLVSPYSVGIYSAGAHHCRYRIEHASGQRDVRDATLFKGIVAVQGGHHLDISLGRVSDSNRVVMISIDGGNDLGPLAKNAEIAVSVGEISSRSGANDITVDAGGSRQAGGVTVSGYRRGPAAVGVLLRSSTRSTLSGIDFKDFRSDGAGRPILIGPGNVDLDSVSGLP